MLTLNEIVKEYGTGEDAVRALRGVSLHFRPHEFVAILGPSGCGKTTLLNIIGGLDQYTDGDLVIEGISTKKYGDSDWDAYRNHRVGFVFQSYNLIPHQTVLSNVELALTLSGVSRAERHERAAQALAQVGLGDQLKKKPNQMSGGQMQRVAIARALINNPEIILADEPTGALDTATSEQVMELLRQVSEDRLIVMVTHNPELAERYATRIIRVVDGLVVDDSNPYDGVSEEVTPEEVTAPAVDELVEELSAHQEEKPKKAKKEKKPSMSFLTALSLSLNNLMTKKARTILTSFAGSIGIIGIALVLALSNGIQLFIDKVQEDTLSSYPIALESGTVDMTSLMNAIMGNGEKVEIIDGYITSNDMLANINTSILQDYKENDLESFKAYIESDASSIRDNATVQYVYSATPQVYKQLQNGTYLSVNPSGILDMLMDYMGMSGSSFSTNVWSEMIDNPELLESQYQMLAGDWPTAYNEVVLVADSNHQIADLMLYALGIRDPKDFESLFTAAPSTSYPTRYSYQDLLNLTFRLVLSCDYYEKDAETGLWTDLREDNAALTDLLNSAAAIDIKVVGIVAPNPDATATSISGTVGFTSALTKYIIEETTRKDGLGNYVHPVVAEQMANPEKDILTGLPFYVADTATPAEQAIKFRTWFESALDKDLALQYEQNLTSIVFSALTEAKFMEIYAAYMYPPTPELAGSPMFPYADQASAEEALRLAVTTLMQEDPTLFNRLKQQMPDLLGNVNTTIFLEYLPQLDHTTLCMLLTGLSVYDGGAYDAAYKTYKTELATLSEAEKAQRYRDYVTSTGALGTPTAPEDEELSAADSAAVKLWETYKKTGTSPSTYKSNLVKMGIADLDKPTAIYLYPHSFEAKEAISAEIERYNQANPDKEITYTDYIGILLSSVSIILDVITYVLVAFISISLIVSSIMIGIITYISVLERIKEIGILRAIGASKRDVSRVFLAETLIVGFAAGMIGILATLLFTIPINIIIRALSGFSNIGAVLPFGGAVLLIAISMLLTLLAGVIPAKLAAKKEPVEALRSE